MARPLRLEFPGALYHIITARGNAQQLIFLEDCDRQQFLRLLGREVPQQRWHCYAIWRLKRPSRIFVAAYVDFMAHTPNGSIVAISGWATCCKAG